ncbi:uncharacterized protein LOC144172488 isoform X2 [Haemaphysalis longicornis]
MSEPTALTELLDVRPESQMEQDIALQGHSGLLLSASNIKAVEDYLPQPTALTELLDVRPESQMEQDIALQGHSGLLLSASNIKAVEDYLPQLKDLEAQLRRERASLVEWLSLHRERRITPRAEREDLQRSHSGLTAATLRELTQQMEECEVLKRQKLQEFPTRAQDGWLTRYSTHAFRSARPSWKRNGTAKLPGISWRREAAPGTCPHRHCRRSGDTCSSHSASSRPRHANRVPHPDFGEWDAARSFLLPLP